MLESIITSRARRAVLTLFLTNPGNSFYLREVAKKTNTATNLASSELARLEKAGFLASERRGNMHYYRVNKAFPIYGELKGIILKTEGVGDALRGAIGKGENVRFAFIYGSFAKGEERAGSDIDLMVIGSAKPEEIAPALRKCERRIGREISYTIYPEAEFLAKRGKGFIREVLRGKKIMIIGDENELERFAG